MKEIGAYILAGGKSSRMGADKGLQLLHGKPMIQHVIGCLQTVFPKINIITNNPDYASLGLRTIPDKIKDKGPLAGIYTGLMDSDKTLNFFVACDMPFISHEAIELLIANAEPGFITVPEIAGKLQPMFAIYPQEIIPDLVQCLQEDKLKMMRIIESLPHRKVNIEDSRLIFQKQFVNINTRKELKAFEAKPGNNNL